MIGHITYGIFLLILLFLVLSRYAAANGLISAAGGTVDTYTKTLQGR